MKVEMVGHSRKDWNAISWWGLEKEGEDLADQVVGPTQQKVLQRDPGWIISVYEDAEQPLVEV